MRATRPGVERDAGSLAAEHCPARAWTGAVRRATRRAENDEQTYDGEQRPDRIQDLTRTRRRRDPRRAHAGRRPQPAPHRLRQHSQRPAGREAHTVLSSSGRTTPSAPAVAAAPAPAAVGEAAVAEAAEPSWSSSSTSL